ncbi:MAG: hypothetical protein NVS3B24_17780 [Candidatus Dormibacteria bacterium]
MPVSLPPPQKPSPPPPASNLPPQFHSERGRRTLALFGVGALVMVAAFVLFTAAQFFYLVRSGNARVSSAVPADLPAEVPFCTGFEPNRSFSTALDGGKHFLVQGTCPENHLQLDNDLTRLLQYNGWTVHDDGQGTLSSYSYDRHQRLDISINPNGVPANQAAVTVEVWTGLKRAPDGFPREATTGSAR